MIVLKSYFNKKKIKVNYVFFTFSFFFIFILLISYFTFNQYIKSNEKDEYKTIQTGVWCCTSLILALER